MNKLPNPKCFASHMGFWMMEPRYLLNAVSAIQSGIMPIKADDHSVPDGEQQLRTDVGGIAIIHINGPIMKGRSKFGGTSSVEARNEIRGAVRDESVKAILLAIDSPGGTVAGTADFAGDVKQAGLSKPVFAQIDDLGASAALWVASQAGQVFAGATAEVGSIGTVGVVEDSSGAAEMAGIKVHVISTGPQKGADTAGAKVTDDHLAALQERVDRLNEFFIEGLAEGRNLSMDAVRDMATGEVFGAAKAHELGLIDGIQTMDGTVEMILDEIANREDVNRREARVRRARGMKR